MEGDVKKILITKLVRKGDTAELFAKGHKFRDTILFDLSDLAEAGIDYVNLPEGQATVCRFWAHCRESEKKNQAGNPYLDVDYLEPTAPISTQQETGGGEALYEIAAQLATIAGELASIRSLMQGKAQVRQARPEARPPASELEPPTSEPEQPIDEPEPPVSDSEPPPELDTETEPHVDDEPDQQDEQDGLGPLNEGMAKRSFSALAGPAIQGGRVDAAQVNELTKAAKVKGWRSVLKDLRALVDAAA